MKKRIAVLLLALICALLCCAAAEDTGDYNYTIQDNGTVMITAYTGYAQAVSIPAALEGRAVTAIAPLAFEGRSWIVSVNIPVGVTAIGQSAFRNCSGMTALSLPEGLLTISEQAFSGCTGLTAIDLPDSINWIGTRAFYGCSSLREITLPEKAIHIEFEAFTGCADQPVSRALRPAAATPAPEAVAATEAPDQPLPFNADMAKPVLLYTYALRDDGTAGITGYTGADTALDIPGQVDGYAVTAIGAGAFMNRDDLTGVRLPEGLTIIENQAFFGCSGLTEIFLPDSIAEVGVQAFWGCSSLRDISLPGEQVAVSSTAFFGCPGQVAYRDVEIPGGPLNLADASDEMTYGDYTYVLLSGGEAMITHYNGHAATLSVPSALDGHPVAAIGELAFYGCEGLFILDLPDGVTVIGDAAFLNCFDLSIIRLPEGLRSIGAEVFLQCVSLAEVTIPGSVTVIGENAFQCFSDQLTLTVSPGSYAEGYCLENGLRHSAR